MTLTGLGPTHVKRRCSSIIVRTQLSHLACPSRLGCTLFFLSPPPPPSTPFGTCKSSCHSVKFPFSLFSRKKSVEDRILIISNTKKFFNRRLGGDFRSWKRIISRERNCRDYFSLKLFFVESSPIKSAQEAKNFSQKHGNTYISGSHSDAVDQ